MSLHLRSISSCSLENYFINSQQEDPVSQRPSSPVHGPEEDVQASSPRTAPSDPVVRVEYLPEKQEMQFYLAFSALDSNRQTVMQRITQIGLRIIELLASVNFDEPLLCFRIERVNIHQIEDPLAVLFEFYPDLYNCLFSKIQNSLRSSVEQK